ncbi:MAG TPA: hypothetical protein VF690_12420 [Hymenobacter sp.]|jgi:hypothetical protein
MRKTDFDFALELLTQADLQLEEMASSSTKVLAVASEKNGLVAWIFNNEGEFLQFDSPFLITRVG